MSQGARFSRLDPELRKALLIKATLVCLKQFGFQGASIRKICAQAGVSVGLISHHYSGKDELVAEAYRSITAQVMQALRSAVAAAKPDARARLSAFFQASFSAEMLAPELLDAWLAFWGAVKTAEAINSAHKHSYGQYRSLLAQMLADLAAEGGWNDFAADLAAVSLSALLDGLWLEFGLNPGVFSPEQGVQICEAWVDGLQAGGYRRLGQA
jgi:TetR/AcrR family transcriptional repressor of bet genes